jgi:hypothetical protein
MSTPTDPIPFSGNFSPEHVESQKGTDEFTTPLDNEDITKQVVGQGNRLFMPGRVRKYIPTLYKQVYLNTRALLSVNGYEVLDGTQDKDGNTKTAVTSDIRNSVIRKDLDVTTASLKDTEVGMTKLVLSEGPHENGKARTLTCADDGSKFMVHDGELYDTYTFVEKGGHIEYVQARQADGKTTVYIVLQYEGFFSNAAVAANKEVPGVQTSSPTTDPVTPNTPATPSA